MKQHCECGVVWHLKIISSPFPSISIVIGSIPLATALLMSSASDLIRRNRLSMADLVQSPPNLRAISNEKINENTDEWYPVRERRNSIDCTLALWLTGDRILKGDCKRVLSSGDGRREKLCVPVDSSHTTPDSLISSTISIKFSNNWRFKGLSGSDNYRLIEWGNGNMTLNI